MHVHCQDRYVLRAELRMPSASLPMPWLPETSNNNQPASSENSVNNQNKGKDKKKNYPPCQHCGKKGHAPFRCWRRLDAKCNKCNQIRHEAVICANKNHHDEGAQIANEEEEDQLFVATCFLSSESSESWLIDSGCTNHMTYDKTLFKDLKPTNVSKVKIENGGYIPVKGKGTVAISTCSDSKQVQHHDWEQYLVKTIPV
ncbi:putative transposon Ty5-1 protein [Glycine max]|nr:putative transposon Ty5-1 protein [Glycine max]